MPGFGRWLLVLAAVVALAWFWYDPGIRHPAGVLVPEEPQQTLVGSGAGWESGAYHLTPLASFRVRALVLHTERYWFDHGAALSPVDFALGWGRMSDQSVVDRIAISQGNRFFQWSFGSRQPPIPIEEIVSHSANMHLIPADASLKDRLLAVRKGDIVTLDGDLVLVEGKNGSKWRSSLSRTDTGSGACELVWVRRVSVQ